MRHEGVDDFDCCVIVTVGTGVEIVTAYEVPGMTVVLFDKVQLIRTEFVFAEICGRGELHSDCSIT